MSIFTNSLVDFLRSYGPIGASDNLYDERIGDVLEKNNIEHPIEIEASRLTRLESIFKGEKPSHVILTGTAGDGKTYHCRRIYEELGGDRTEWQTGSKIIEVSLPSSKRRLKIVKDLSELTDEEKNTFLREFCDALLRQENELFFLVAANDGQLLSSLDIWTSEQDEYRDIFTHIESMLVGETKEYEKQLNLSLYNLSRLDASEDFNKILDAMVEHPQWKNCEGCSLYRSEEETRCPIRINRRMLQNKSDGTPSLFRRRLTQLLQLSKANDLHLPIRHLFLLGANIILGDSTRNNPDRLMTCKIAIGRDNNRSSAQPSPTNPYANVFGFNLKENDRLQYQAFVALNSFGIGRETNNAVDSLLVFGDYYDSERYKRLVDNDIYGETQSYKNYLREYIEGDRSPKNVNKFLMALTRQRQRLFFTIEDDEEGLDPWQMTVYSASAQFLELCEKLKNGQTFRTIFEKLILGLNRVFCGMMLEKKDEVYVTSSGGDGRGKISSIHIEKLSAGESANRVHLKLEIEPPKNPLLPDIVVYKPDGCEIERMPLPLTHFEFLIKIASGGLPANFSRQCYEDFLDMKLRLIDNLDGVSDCSDTISFKTISINANGEAPDTTITIEIER